MAETLKIPTKLIDSEWRDDVDVDYAIYGGNEKKEREFISPETLSDEARIKIEEIKRKSLRSRGFRNMLSSKITYESKMAA